MVRVGQQFDLCRRIWVLSDLGLGLTHFKLFVGVRVFERKFDVRFWWTNLGLKEFEVHYMWVRSNTNSTEIDEKLHPFSGDCIMVDSSI